MGKSRILQLALDREFFEDIRDGSKLEEYREVKPYWTKRIEGREYDEIILTLGYPLADNESRRLRRPYLGYVKKRIIHPKFGPDEVEVYAIKVN
jgi:hypothetical protein